MFVIENKLSLSYRRVKLMHYPESPKVNVDRDVLKDQELNFFTIFSFSQFWHSSFSPRIQLGKIY